MDSPNQNLPEGEGEGHYLSAACFTMNIVGRRSSTFVRNIGSVDVTGYIILGNLKKGVASVYSK